MTDTAVPKRRKTKPESPAVAPESAPDKPTYPSPRQKDAPRTMRELRLSRGARKRPAKADENPLREQFGGHAIKTSGNGGSAPPS